MSGMKVRIIEMPCFLPRMANLEMPCKKNGLGYTRMRLDCNKILDMSNGNRVCTGLGLYMPLLVPHASLEDVSINFIWGLPGPTR